MIGTPTSPAAILYAIRSALLPGAADFSSFRGLTLRRALPRRPSGHV